MNGPGNKIRNPKDGDKAVLVPFHKSQIFFIALILPFTMVGCLATPSEEIGPPVLLDFQREDGAVRVDLAMEGSLQNPQWSPYGNSLLFTRFRGGYNVEPADLLILDLVSGSIRDLVSDGSGNINLPGSSWNTLTGMIVFSSSREPHDEIYVIDADAGPGAEIRITGRNDLVAYEPSISPDGEWIVFESHVEDVEGNGIIVKYRIDGTAPYLQLTPGQDDCRQPNWSPDGARIIYQGFDAGLWDIWIMNSDGSDPYTPGRGPGDRTDASFSPDGQWIVYSSNEEGGEFANLFIMPAAGGESYRLTNYAGYDGAPVWSPNGEEIAFESFPGDPDGSPGTTLWTVDVPQMFK